jgi:hypothetical protein
MAIQTDSKTPLADRVEIFDCALEEPRPQTGRCGDRAGTIEQVLIVARILSPHSADSTIC